jgi:hypothetical protein
MNENNKIFIVTGLGAAILDAENHVSTVRPGGIRINPQPRIYWSEATKEQQEDSKIMWCRFPKEEPYMIRPLTKAEKKEIRLNQEYRLRQMYDYILNKYGWRMAARFYNQDSWKKQFDEAEIVINFKIPHCKYDEIHQCDLECPFFNGQCTYKGEL